MQNAMSKIWSPVAVVFFILFMSACTQLVSNTKQNYSYGPWTKYSDKSFRYVYVKDGEAQENKQCVQIGPSKKGSHAPSSFRMVGLECPALVISDGKGGTAIMPYTKRHYLTEFIDGATVVSINDFTLYLNEAISPQWLLKHGDTFVVAKHREEIMIGYKYTGDINVDGKSKEFDIYHHLISPKEVVNMMAISLGQSENGRGFADLKPKSEPSVELFVDGDLLGGSLLYR